MDTKKYWKLLGIGNVFLILIISSIIVGLRSYFREPISDDLLYRYILDGHSLGYNVLGSEVKCLSDAISSQVTQYFYSNGRTLIHILVQMFAGPWGMTAYSIFLGILFLCIEILFVRQSFSIGSIRNPMVNMIVIISLLYLFPDNSGSWYSIAGGMNYLFPMLLALIFLWLVERFVNVAYEGSRRYNLIYCTIIATFGLVTGWSQECFSLPLSGGLFFVLLFNRKLLKNRELMILTISLWVGTAILVFAPGNFVRLGNSKGIVLTFINGVKLLYGTRLFWAFIIGMTILRFKDRMLYKSFVSNNQLVLIALGCSLFLGLVANTLPQSFNGISFYSAILVFRIIGVSKFFDKKTSIFTFLIADLLLIPLIYHQYRIISNSRMLQHINHEFVQEYIKSPDGIMLAPEVVLPKDVSPFISNWYTGEVKGWRMHTLWKSYGHNNKRLKLLNELDFEAYAKKNLFRLSHRPIGRSVNVYRGDEYLWIYDDVPCIGDTLQIRFSSSNKMDLIEFLRKLKWKINGYKPAEYVSIGIDSILPIRKDGIIGIPIGADSIENVLIKKKK